ncbi:MAG: hypothetical protein R3236_10515 [Phycisphaeraceae bacterium]|nr:hypothetical protein [Phycisphaeraceae bacterium]
MRRLCTFLLAGTLLMLTACGSGNRLTSFADHQIDEGVVSVNGTLIRTYSDLKLRAAYETFQKFAKAEGWLITTQKAKLREACIEGKMKDGTEYKLIAWTPKGKPTEVGVHIDPQDRFKAADVLTKLEKSLPGKRIKTETKKNEAGAKEEEKTESK